MGGCVFRGMFGMSHCMCLLHSLFSCVVCVRSNGNPRFPSILKPCHAVPGLVKYPLPPSTSAGQHSLSFGLSAFRQRNVATNQPHPSNITLVLLESWIIPQFDHGNSVGHTIRDGTGRTGP